MIVTTQLDQILEVDAENRVAWVEPGVLNLDLSRAVAHLGLHYAPDPSSQAACTIGGNVATNAGGPHCLASGVTAAHVLALEVVLADGSVAMLGGLAPDQPGYDLRGCFVGSEGTMGIATRIAVRLMPDPPAVRTLLLDFTSIDDAAATVSGVIAAGIVPAALEMMDAQITRAVEDFVGAGFPRDAAAVLLVELDGLPGGVQEEVEAVAAVGRAHGARTVRIAADEDERALLWKGRKSAFGAIARLAPNYYLHDAVVPRTRLVEVLRQVYAIADEQRLTMMNVFHAGDGNLHPLIVFDAREPDVWERVHRAGDEIIAACVAAGGVLSGEHGIGVEKRDAMPLVFSPNDLDAQARLPRRVRPVGPGEPRQGAAVRQSLRRAPPGSRGRVDLMPDLDELCDAVSAATAVVPVGGRTQWEVGGVPPATAVEVRAPSGVEHYDPADLTIRVNAGTTVAELDAVLEPFGQECPLDPASPAATVGGVIATGLSGLRRLRYGPVRDRVLEVRFVTADGACVKGGGPTVKNVSGYDLPRLLIGSLGTIGVLTQVVLRCQPRPRAGRWVRFHRDPFGVRAVVLRPSCIAWDGATTTVLLEGERVDVDADLTALRREIRTGRGRRGPEPPARTAPGTDLRPAELRRSPRRDAALRGPVRAGGDRRRDGARRRGARTCARSGARRRDRGRGLAAPRVGRARLASLRMRPAPRRAPGAGAPGLRPGRQALTRPVSGAPTGASTSAGGRECLNLEWRS